MIMAKPINGRNPMVNHFFLISEPKSRGDDDFRRPQALEHDLATPDRVDRHVTAAVCRLRDRVPRLRDRGAKGDLDERALLGRAVTRRRSERREEA